MASTANNRVDMGACRNPALNIRPDLARAATAITGPSVDDELVGPRGSWWYTGKHPTECPGFDKSANVLRSLPLPNLRNFTRQSVLDYFDNMWTQTEVLFASLQTTDAFIRQPYHQLRHPMIFYYGHTAVVYINKLRVAGLREDPINQYFEQLFETGVDEMSWDDLSRGRDDWPPVREVTDYRRQAYAVVRDIIAHHPALDRTEVGWDDPAWAVFMGFEHERIHIETSSVLIRELPLTSVRKPEFWPDYHPSSRSLSAPVPTEGVDYPANKLVHVPGELVVLGKDRAYPSFGWDNEYGRKEILVHSFRASQYKVTNGEFVRFVKAGGYMAPKYWSSEGWAWKTFRNVKWPTFWMPDGPQGLHKYKLRVMFDAIDMRWDWPVDVNYHEGRAFAAWRTEQDGAAVRYRLITEAEHQLIRNTRDRVDAHRLLPAALAAPADSSAPASASPALSPDLAMELSGETALQGGFNVQLAYGSQNPVTELPPSDKGFYDTFGSAWEWGEDHYAAFPGFKVHPYYEDFSAPCFAGKHQLILGGSFISTGQLASKFARYQFRPHFFQHATFRLVQADVDMSLYDSERYGAHNPVTPFYETSCMDAAPPHVGDGPCCSVSRRAAFTPTVKEEAASTKAKLEAAQVAYETDAILSQYLSLHYGPVDRVYPDLARETSGIIADALDFPRKLADCLTAWAERAGVLPAEGAEASVSGREGAGAAPRVLDLGCAVGRSSFELGRRFGEVVGVDLSKTFIEVACKIRDNGRMDYDCTLEGEITERLTAALPATPSASSSSSSSSPAATAAADSATARRRCRFLQGDACNLPASLLGPGAAGGQFDAVLAANLLDRVPEPAACLGSIRAALRPGGVALLTCPFSWLETYTDPGNWVGGRYKEGLPNRSSDALKALVAPDFEVLEEGAMPLLIREHCRKYQLIAAYKLVLRRK